MLHVYVGSSKPDLISQRNTQITNIADDVLQSQIFLRSQISLAAMFVIAIIPVNTSPSTIAH